MAGKSSHAGSAGKGITETASKWALQKIAAVHCTLAKKAQQLDTSFHSKQNAHAHLQELSAAGKVPSSLCVELSSVALALLPKVPGALEELVALEKLFMKAEIAKLQREAAQDGAALQDILTGDAFVSACRQAMEFDSLSAKTQATLLPLITEAEEDFKLDMEFAQVDLQEHATKEEAAPTKTELAWTAGRARKKAHKSRKTMV